MSECLSTYDNCSVQNKSYVSLKPVNLKPFYFKPYLTHESEIRFAEAEMEKLRQMSILCRGSSVFLSPIMLIKKSHSSYIYSVLDLKHYWGYQTVHQLLCFPRFAYLSIQQIEPKTEHFSWLLYFTHEWPITWITTRNSWKHRLYYGWHNHFYTRRQIPQESSEMFHAYVEKI